MTMLANRHSSGYHLITLDILDDGVEDGDDEVAVATFRRWIAEQGELQKYATVVNVVVVDDFPPMPSLPEYL